MRFRILISSSAVALLVFSSCATPGPRFGRPPPPLAKAAERLQQARRESLPVETRAGYYLDAAALASAQFRASGAGDSARTIYNESAAEITGLLRKADGGRLWNHPLAAAVEGMSYRLRFQPGAREGVWSPDEFSDFKLARNIPRRHLRHSVAETGVGGTLVGIRKTPGFGPHARAPFEPKAGFVAPVTATLDFTGGEVSLTLHDPSARRTTRLRGHTEPLAADFTAPIACLPIRNELWQGLMGLMHVEEHLGSTGLYMLHPYDPDRIPVILVHGLLSTPQMWVNVINELESAPGLRGRFQFWAFQYPTGIPAAYSALRFREELARMQRLHPMPRGFVIVGHSMGGILSRMQATDAARVVWEANFRSKSAALDARLPADHLVKRALIFNANPQLKRIIFVCVPHRGSELALGTIGAIGKRLITLPTTLVTTLTGSLGDVLKAAEGRTSLPNGITSLSPRNPTLLALDKLPIRAPHHSIVGDRGKGNSPQSSDGVVPYWSAHLSTAQSELIVPGPHGSYELPQTIAELQRILRQHLAERRP